MLRRLKKGGYITSSNKVVCTLKELNKYRHYLTSLKLDFERNYIREQKMIEEQLNKLYETKRAREKSRFHDWLLQGSTRATPKQDLIIKNRYIDMINRELEKEENQNRLQMKEERQHHQDHIRRKLSLRRQIEEEWKAKEMLLLEKIGEEVRREAQVEKHRQNIREAACQKKRVLLEKKMAYHLQRMQKNNLKREVPEGKLFESKEQRKSEGLGQRSHSFIKIPTKTSPTLLPHQHDVQSNTTEQKKDKETPTTSHLFKDEGSHRASFQGQGVSDRAENISKHPKQNVVKKKVTYADLNGNTTKKSSLNCDSAHRTFPSHDLSIKPQNHDQNHWQEKIATRKSSNNLNKPDISKVETLIKDVQSKKELIIQLVTHDVNQEVSEDKEENVTSDEDEVVLQEVVKGFPKDLLEHQVKDVKPIESTVTFPKLPTSKSSLQHFLSPGKDHSKSSVTTRNIEASTIQWTESEETQMKGAIPKVNTTTSISLTDTDSSLWERKTQLSREEMESSIEPIHSSIYRIMSTSSFNEEDLPSFSSDDDCRSDPSAKVTEDSFEMESASNIQFVTLFQCESAMANLHFSSDDISDTDKPSTSGSGKMKEVSSSLSKVVSRSKDNVPKSSSHSLPHQDR